jgi:hypothetical protein
VTKVQKGDILRYTGPYASADVPRYPEGVAVSFRNGRHGAGKLVIVQLLDGSGSYADWPVEEVEVVL